MEDKEFRSEKENDKEIKMNLNFDKNDMKEKNNLLEDNDNFQINNNGNSNQKVTKFNGNNKEIFEPKNYNKIYSILKKKLGIQNDLRKLDFDSSLKKIKAKVFKTIHYCLRSLIKENFFIKRLPQSFIVDIRIDTNKVLFDMTINEIYKNHNININYDDLERKDFIKKGKENLLKLFLFSKFDEIFDFYRYSKQYERDKIKFIRHNNDRKFGLIFDYTIDNYKNYFFSGKGNKKIKKRRISFKVITSLEKYNN